MIIGGSNKKEEAIKINRGVNIIIATPGWLLDHLMNTEALKLDNLKLLVIDEADHILRNGFEQEMNQILNLLPKNRQTALFSAT